MPFGRWFIGAMISVPAAEFVSCASGGFLPVHVTILRFSAFLRAVHDLGAQSRRKVLGVAAEDLMRFAPRD